MSGIRHAPTKRSLRPMRVLLALLTAASACAEPAAFALGPHGAAHATFNETAFAVTGWATLEVVTIASFPDVISAYDAGFVEGTLTQHMTFLFSLNLHGGKSTFSPALQQYVSSNLAYMQSQVQAHPGDLYWQQVNLTLSQWWGFRDGYMASAPADEQLDEMALLSLSLVGDLDDLCPAFGCNAPSPRGQHTCQTKAECDAVPLGPVHFQRPGNGHCTILIKNIGTSFAPSDILVGHTTWDPLTAMLRIMKRYHFAFVGVAAVSQVFSSFPGVLYSFDDWYQLDTGLIVSETTIINANPALWSLVQPSAVPDWIRNMVANRLATDGASWAEIFSRENSGTYNNAFHVIDWNKFSPGAAPLPGFLTTLEQMPGQIVVADRTEVLRIQTYWGSYNRIMDPSLFNLTGQWDLVKRFGDHFTYDLTSRSVILRREQAKVVDEFAFVSLMRYNDFLLDPVAGQGCRSGYSSASNAISERGDLSPMDPSCSAAQGVAQFNEAGIDLKYTSLGIMAGGQHPWLRMKAQSGPTTFNNQPPFRWSTSPFASLSHLGMPDLWDFPFVEFDAQWSDL